MFTSLKRSPGATLNSSARTEKFSGANYADLEKRADGRWSVQIRPGSLEAAVDAVNRDDKTSRRETCCGFLPAHLGVLLFTLLALMVAMVFMGVLGVNIAQNGVSLASVVGDDGLTAVLKARRCGMSTPSLLLPLYRFGHSSS
jgi:hypothetical protein